MATALSVFLSTVKAIVGRVDTDELPDADVEDRIRAAIQRYNKDSDALPPYFEDVTGDGGKYYSIPANLTQWSEGFSDILTIEYPAITIASDDQPTFLSPDDWNDDYWIDESGTQVRYLFMKNHSPAATETMRISYTAPYSFSGDPETVDTPAEDFYALCNLSAGLVCQLLAAKYAAIGNAIIAADSSDHVSKSEAYADRADEYIDLYLDHMGIGKDDEGDAIVAPASEFLALESKSNLPSGRYLFR
jgi:hypothetical protein